MVKSLVSCFFLRHSVYIYTLAARPAPPLILTVRPVLLLVVVLVLHVTMSDDCGRWRITLQCIAVVRPSSTDAAVQRPAVSTSHWRRPYDEFVSWAVAAIALWTKCVHHLLPHLNIPPHLKWVATLPCEIWIQKTGGSLKYVLWLMINHKVV